MRTREAVVEAARTLFLRKGYAGTTMDDIADQAGITRRTLYNNYASKDALFTQIVAETIEYADTFARTLDETFAARVATPDVNQMLHELGLRLALAIVRPEVVALRRLLIGESRDFPALSVHYFDRAPGRVIAALTDGFAQLEGRGLLRIADARVAAEQFAYLVAGAPLDRAMLAGTVAVQRSIIEGAREGVETFLARFGTAPRGASGSARGGTRRKRTATVA